MSVAQALGVRSYRELLSAGEARRVIWWGLLARMPMGMSALALVLLVRSEGGSYATAGIVSGTYAVASGVGSNTGTSPPANAGRGEQSGIEPNHRGDPKCPMA